MAQQLATNYEAYQGPMRAMALAVSEGDHRLAAGLTTVFRDIDRSDDPSERSDLKFDFTRVTEADGYVRPERMRPGDVIGRLNLVEPGSSMEAWRTLAIWRMVHWGAPGAIRDAFAGIELEQYNEFLADRQAALDAFEHVGREPKAELGLGWASPYIGNVVDLTAAAESGLEPAPHSGFPQG